MMNHGNTIKTIKIFPVQSKGKITIGMNRTKQASADKRKKAALAKRARAELFKKKEARNPDFFFS